MCDKRVKKTITMPEGAYGPEKQITGLVQVNRDFNELNKNNDCKYYENSTIFLIRSFFSKIFAR
jgi:hypothetical protein